jgi:hypothetical protein
LPLAPILYSLSVLAKIPTGIELALLIWSNAAQQAGKAGLSSVLLLKDLLLGVSIDEWKESHELDLRR